MNREHAKRPNEKSELQPPGRKSQTGPKWNDGALSAEAASVTE